MGNGQRYVSARDAGIYNVGGEWIKEGSQRGEDSLNSLMEPDHVIRVGCDGLVHNDVRNTFAPEIDMQTDDDGQIMPEHDAALIASLEGQGWNVEKGWTGQYGAHRGDPIMHASEFIGGPLAEHVIGTPGLWVACAVMVESEECPNGSESCLLSDPCVICTDGTGEQREREDAGWVILHRPVPATLGKDESGTENRRYWPVLWDGKPTGTYVDETLRGYIFRAPHTMTPDGFPYKGTPRDTADDAREDAEEWLTENVA